MICKLPRRNLQINIVAMLSHVTLVIKAGRDGHTQTDKSPEIHRERQRRKKLLFFSRSCACSFVCVLKGPARESFVQQSSHHKQRLITCRASSSAVYWR